ncbi:MAG: hypothetical protein BWK78_02815 [Thiotrichaceae bacterium IS1]|nr:MAG: hypothetical protein BWK78_02815 [Thiotrichaceae bacterium IS1]
MSKKTLKDSAANLDLLVEKLKEKYLVAGYHVQVQKATTESQPEKAFIVTIKSPDFYEGFVGQLRKGEIELTKRGNDLEYEVSGGQWIDKTLLGSAAFFNIVLAVLIVPAFMGVVKQFRFFEELEEELIKLNASFTK